MKANIPLFRAKEINTNELLVGNYNFVNGKHYMNDTCGDLDDTDYGWGFREIDTSTLSISFDGGNSWYSDFESIADICREYLPKIEQRA